MTETINYPENDNIFTEGHIRYMQDGNGSYYITQEDGFFCCVSKSMVTAQPVIGDTIRVYSKGLGFNIRGIFINGQKVFYRTEEEDREHQRLENERIHAERAEEAKRREPEFDARIAALPVILQNRIQGFRDRNPTFAVDVQPYELFCCEQAVVIQEALQTEADIRAFYSAEYTEQKALVPKLDDGHSGNTFSASVGLAIALANPDKHQLIPRMHGALCAMIGCQDYGCWAVSDEANDD